MSSKRPGALTAFGIMNIVFGSIWSLCCFCSGGGMFFVGAVMQNPPPNDDPEFQKQLELLRGITDNVPSFVAYFMVMIFGTAILAFVMLIAGIGLLQVKKWGRVLSILVASANIVLYIGLTVFFLGTVIPNLRDWVQQAPPGMFPQPAPQNDAVDVIQHVVLMFFMMLYSILLLIFMFVPNVRKAFEPRSQLGYDQYDRDQEVDDYERRRRDEPT